MLNWWRGKMRRRRGIVCWGCGRSECPIGPYAPAPEGWMERHYGAKQRSCKHPIVVIAPARCSSV